MMLMQAIRKGPRPRTLDLIEDYSLEITAKDVDNLAQAALKIPAGTRISVTFLPNEDLQARIEAAATVRRLGFVPVPHISARRLRSQHELEGFLEALAREARIDDAFVVAGDPPRPEGPYEDALAVIRSGLLEKYGIRHIGISGYPEGHPDIGPDKLMQAMRDKLARIEAQGLEASITTQFGFDAAPILSWLERIRAAGIHEPVRIGVPGPCNVGTLLRFAARCGVGASASVMAKYGVSITRVLSTAGPDPLVTALAAGLDPAVHGSVSLHLYPFGGLLKSAEWAEGFMSAQAAATR
ncbi:methylenetetrahydrofolate reductase [Nitratireductor thuwali]|uniref:Methylenetetrahydrofolate reductase n=1 Tax=Nitratireductor thuwali TaxID=2267699 RepID=A0ABY5MF84_9HYPH|nr:hypothetical protein NTH_01150 [Nitratireductor thuwali]